LRENEKKRKKEKKREIIVRELIDYFRK